MNEKREIEHLSGILILREGYIERKRKREREEKRERGEERERESEAELNHFY
jgi:hypothetical protein